MPVIHRPSSHAGPTDDPRDLVRNVIAAERPATVAEARELHHLVLLAHGLDMQSTIEHWAQVVAPSM